MDTSYAIGGSPPLFNIASTRALASPTRLREPEESRPTPTLFGSTTLVDLSILGQVVSSAATFQDQLHALQPGTATSGGGQNFGTNFASLTAETQSLVDAFNMLQDNIRLSGSPFFGGAAFALRQALDTQAQAIYANGNSALTNLSQLGIQFQPSSLPGGGSLSIDLAKLQTAFNSDAAGAFSLLSKAVTALGTTAGNFVEQSGGRYAILAVLQQITGSLLSDNQSSNDDFNSANLQNNWLLSGSAEVQKRLGAMNEFAAVSSMVGTEH